MRSRSWLVLALAAVAATVLLVWITSSLWLRAIGGMLVSDSQPRRADAAIVLAGDYRGSRMLKACELLRAGYVPVVLVSGPMGWYGINEADLAIRFAIGQGCPAGSIQPLYINAHSTAEEAREVRPELERRGIGSVLLVTSNFHTSRALRTFRRTLPKRIEILAIAAPDPYFTPDTWWHNREGQKTMFFEFSKTVADWIGL